MLNNATMEQKYGPAMAIIDEFDAKCYLDECVEHNLNNSDHSLQEARQIERSNLAYYAGYHDHETRLRVERLFECEHPILGPATSPLTPDECFKLGREWGKRMKDKRHEI